jgi:hypothetical protein
VLRSCEVPLLAIWYVKNTSCMMSLVGRDQHFAGRSPRGDDRKIVTAQLKVCCLSSMGCSYGRSIVYRFVCKQEVIVVKMAIGSSADECRI